MALPGGHTIAEDPSQGKKGGGDAAQTDHVPARLGTRDRGRCLFSLLRY